MPITSAGGDVSHDGNGKRARTIVINVQRLNAARTVVHVVGDLIGHATVGLQQVLIDELSRAPALLIVDLSTITRIDAGGVHALAAAAAVAGESDRALCLVARQAGAVQAALAAENLSELFESFSSVSEAVQNPR
jgi:anti-anti-sigma regulatory factor